jgi:predicted ATPase
VNSQLPAASRQPPNVSPAEHHAAREAASRAAEERCRRTSMRLSTGRLVSALATAGLAMWALDAAAPVGVGWLAIAGLVIFTVLVVVHDRVERRAAAHAVVASWHERRRLRLERAWSELSESWQPDLDPHHPFAHDLDLFGRASLFALIGPPGTQAGRAALAGWLLEPGDVLEIEARQGAVRELASRPDLCERLAVHGEIVGRVAAFDLRVFLDWAEAAPWLRARPWVAWLARGLGVGTPVLLLMEALGVMQASWWLLTAAAGLVMSWALRHPMEQTLGRATGWEPAVRAYVDWLRLVEQTRMTSAWLARVQARVGTGDRRASRAVARFQRWVSLAELRHNALLHFPVHALTLWDVHVWWALERWQADHGARVREWLDALGQLEAAVGLGALAHDHPDWVRPTVTVASRRLTATALGHPLLVPAMCVRNDVSVGPPGRVLCITGSNMSGKSTLLRALGCNAVLAQAGAPVCAATFDMPPVTIYTSLRVVDSLADGVSFFMAAAEQLKRVVDAADTASRANAPRLVLYLLDEILQGTNSVERGTAVRMVLRHLLARPAIGAITTHDLALTTTPELQAHGDHVHFRETVVAGPTGPRMTFDYLARPGVATSRNALALLRLIGLGEP